MQTVSGLEPWKGEEIYGLKEQALALTTIEGNWTAALVSNIPDRSNARARPSFFPKRLYRLRARFEQFIGKIKRFKRIAMRCEKTKQNYAAFVALACVFILVKSVHTA